MTELPGVTDWSCFRHVEITCLLKTARGVELKSSKYSRGICTRATALHLTYSFEKAGEARIHRNAKELASDCTAEQWLGTFGFLLHLLHV